MEGECNPSSTEPMGSRLPGHDALSESSYVESEQLALEHPEGPSGLPISNMLLSLIVDRKAIKGRNLRAVQHVVKSEDELMQAYLQDSDAEDQAKGP